MTFRRLLVAEAHKLVRSHVFWVAPVVLAVYLVLMLFGFEVYAAKNGVPAPGTESVSVQGQMTGSVVVSAYATVRRMALNLIGLPAESRLPGAVMGTIEEGDVPVEDRKIKVADGYIGKLDFWGTFFKNLISPKPFPKQNCDCPCAPTKESLPGAGPPGGDKGIQPSAGLIGLFVGVAYADPGTTVFAPKPPLEADPNASFMERLQHRLYWLTESVPLEGRLIDRSRFNGMRFTYLSLYFSLVFVFPIIAVTVAAHMFAGEIAGGTLRTSLLRPVRRGHLLLAKLAVLAGYLLLLILVFSIVTMAVGVAFSGYGNLVLDSDVLGTMGSGKLILADGAVMLFLVSTPVAVISLLPLALFAVLLSYLKPEPAYVIGVSSVVYLILFTLGGLPLFEDIRFLFFTTYMDSWLLMFDSPVNAGTFAFKITIIALMAFGILAAVNRMFLTKDIFE